MILIIILCIVIISTIAISLRNRDYSPSSNSSSPADIVSESSSDQSTEKPPIVIIDAGHGGWEPGAGNGSTNEKDLVLAISLEIEKVLKEKNIDSYMIRNDDTYVSLEDRVRIANEKMCSLFVSIHNNSFTDSSQGGILTTYNPYSSTGEDIAKIMQSNIGDIGMRNRDIVPRPTLYVLRHTNMPSLLLEIGFISNKNDLKLITDSSFQQKCAKQIVLGIEEILRKYTTDEVKSSVGD
ncbi:MAG TPA: N-acetylmuramoyl-L-alanine amidase [Ruminiclostridium sp.]